MQSLPHRRVGHGVSRIAVTPPGSAAAVGAFEDPPPGPVGAKLTVEMMNAKDFTNLCESPQGLAGGPASRTGRDAEAGWRQPEPSKTGQFCATNCAATCK
jgi:hypothetical protein